MKRRETLGSGRRYGGPPVDRFGGTSLPGLPIKCSEGGRLGNEEGVRPNRYCSSRSEATRGRESNNISYIYMYRINFHKLKVLNDITTD